LNDINVLKIDIIFINQNHSMIYEKRVDKIFSVDKKLIYMKIGKINEETFEEIKEKFIQFI
jgi:hypothetical protein